MNYEGTYRIFPLGDSAIVIDFAKQIDETTSKKVLTLFQWLSDHPLPGMTECVPAYTSLTLYYDTLTLRKIKPKEKGVFEWMKEQLDQLSGSVSPREEPERIVKIPVCYEKDFAPDLEAMAADKKITVAEIIRIHLATAYRVYMLGFLPGFAYLGRLDERIVMPRKRQPVPVSAGSIGIAGNQTGIYPLSSPGGWHIIGRTPLQLFNPQQKIPTLLRAGDTVKFYSISSHEFTDY